VKSTARFIKLSGLNAYIWSSKLSWLSSNWTPNLLHNSNVPTPTVLTLVTLDAANLNSACDCCGRQVLEGLLCGQTTDRRRFWFNPSRSMCDLWRTNCQGTLYFSPVMITPLILRDL
jgi:hypothetical protein